MRVENRMSRRYLAILITIAAVLTLQFIVPVIQYPLDGANRWGWQMYSRENPRQDIVALLPDGERVEVEFSDHVFGVRAEMRLTAPVLEQLCDRVIDAESLELYSPSSGELESVFPCNR